MLIGLTIAILYFLARKITAEGAEERGAFNRLGSLRVPPRTLRLNSRFGYNISHVPGSLCIVKSHDGGFRYLSSYHNFKMIQTIFGSLEDITAVQSFRGGHGDGSFVVMQALK